ncbi:hypothetical protein BJF86_08720 [Serinicoccus sp. CNJ-927]|uniref:hypothetical protein n=1 Tax=Serinicoccus sp. CNJ-927 TaxID=1904970 RepID=UPI00095FF3D8|nr:hypothetical protein [Serinicoccus sp. CNJ-927]OLT39482.1 hypothetical protein BJF86_08720 [Serinicoccus sp. CNJ-927]
MNVVGTTPRRTLVALAGLLTLGACGGSQDAPAQDGQTTATSTAGSETAEQRFPDVVEAELVPAEEGTYDVEQVTVEGRDQQYGYGGGTVTADVP